MSNNSNMKTWQSILVGLIIGFLGGVGTMQASLVGDVREHTVKLESINRSAEYNTTQIEQRYDRVIRLMESLLETNRQLIVELGAKRNQ